MTADEVLRWLFTRPPGLPSGRDGFRVPPVQIMTMMGQTILVCVVQDREVHVPIPHNGGTDIVAAVAGAIAHIEYIESNATE